MKKIILYIFLCSITTLLVLNPQESIFYAKEGINLCLDIIIPSLFPFFICSGLLVYSGFCEVLARLFNPIMKPLFNINPTGASAFVLGIVSGYPIGAATACELYNSLYISKSEAERLLAFCNNSGPLFILGAVGVSMYHSVRVGVILYVCHILGAITVGILFKNYKKDTFCAPRAKIETREQNISLIFSEVLKNSIQNILIVCGTVIFMSAITNVLLDIASFNSVFSTLFLSLSEFVSGLKSVSSLNLDIFYKLLLSAWICAFAGISVHLQVMGVVSKTGLSLKPYILGKILHGFISLFYTFIALKILPYKEPCISVFNQSQKYNFSFFTSSLYQIIAVFVIFIFIFLLSFNKKKRHREIF